jgi:Nickel/cobalt transporter regulator
MTRSSNTRKTEQGYTPASRKAIGPRLGASLVLLALTLPVGTYAQAQQASGAPFEHANRGGGNGGGRGPGSAPAPAVAPAQAPAAPARQMGAPTAVPGMHGNTNTAPQTNWQVGGWSGNRTVTVPQGTAQQANPAAQANAWQGSRPGQSPTQNPTARPGGWQANSGSTPAPQNNGWQGNRQTNQGQPNVWRGADNRGNEGRGNEWRGRPGGFDRDAGRQWSRDWRSDRRYDWHEWRERNREVYHLGFYYPPYRGYGYNRLSVGFFLQPLFFSQRYWIYDPWTYHLPEVYGPYRWVRYYDDALLVDVETGQVVDVLYGVFW